MAHKRGAKQTAGQGQGQRNKKRRLQGAGFPAGGPESGSSDGRQERPPRPGLQAPRERLLFGRKAVFELLLHDPSMIETVFLAEGVHLPLELAELLETRAGRGLALASVERQVLRDAAGEVNEQGVAALLRPQPVYSFEQIAAAGRRENGSQIIVVLDELGDPQNLGSVLRAAEAAGAEGVLLTSRRSAQVTAAVRKVSAGASELLPIAAVGNLGRTLIQLREAGYWIVGTALGPESQPLYSAQIPLPAALVFGSEGKGLRALTKKYCDLLVRIPMPGRIQSLNVAQAASVVLFEMVRRRAGSV